MSSSCAPTDRLMQTLRVMMPGITDDLLSLQLFNVIDEFCRRTSAWKFMQDIELKEGEQEYGLAIPADAVIVRVMGASHNNVPVPTTTQGGTGATYNSLGVLAPEQTFPDGDAEFAFAQADMGPTNVFTYAIYRPEYLTITGAPDAEARKFPFKLVAALSIGKHCLECDCGDWQLEEWMYDMYFQDWLDGTASRCFAMASKPWTSEKLATYHGKRFRNWMAYRKQEAARGFVYNVPAWRFPRTGWT